ncbi:daunorubicin/doxorubicin resistance ABC transporter ATP-binding protein DrrA [Streptomyces venezuelae]|uniref:ABC-type xenobiotic transporter n=1 Tax=Streptomyces venezuelae TaxID=54571 RepID=A0A5P2DV27_STRVZ|nr:ATP-binding cassette domain-containing protein [Streptomyces venezuelae]QES57091.1 daunorubicin/doxorubicin resistance ABC transporter ATP-binding protein DrrA [Streptomyces venezuelae]
MAAHAPTAIEAEGLRKNYKDQQVLKGIDLHVPAGTVLGLLGPNGAGKTTTVRILSTLLRGDGGRATVCGFDVSKDPREVRRRIGLSGQYAAVDEELSGRENLVLLGRLLHLGAPAARARAEEMLSRFHLGDAGDKPLREYSGGMRRRLDLASTLVGSPEVIFLDEPTTGLDPKSRLDLWAVVRELVAEGVTVLLTTQYLEEADELADRIAVIDRGTVVAEGSADELKRKVGEERLEITVADPADLPAALTALSGALVGELTRDDHKGVLGVRLKDGLAGIASAAAALHQAGIPVSDFAQRRPSLDEVFLTLTGQQAA